MSGPREPGLWRSLRGRFLLSFAAVALPLGGAMLVALALVHGNGIEHASRAAERRMRDALAEKGRLLAQSHALTLRGLVDDNAASDVESVVLQAVSSDPDVIYGLFISSEGIPWVYASPSTQVPVGQSSPESQGGRVDYRELGLTTQQLSSAVPSQRTRRLFGVEVLEFASPVLEAGELLGTLHYGISTAGVERALADARRLDDTRLVSALVVLSALVLLCIALGLLLAHRLFSGVSRPLLLLGDVVRKQAEGEREARASVATGDELQTLAEDVNRLLDQTQQAVERLTQQAEQARESARQKSEFLANMSHEIRTPMNGVIGMAQLMLNQPLDGKLRRYAETIDASSNALLTIINDVLDFSRLEAGQQVLQQAPFEPRLVAQDVAELLVPRALEKGLDLVCRIAPDVPESVVGDADRFRQVLHNLVGNAIKFTDVGEVFLDVTLESRMGDQARLHVAVSDTGIGIAEKDLSAIFQAFSQVDGALVREHGGTGLGLAISKRVVEMMGGTLGVWSRPGMGSQFWFTVDGQVARGAGLLGLPPGKAALVLEANHRWREVIGEQLKAWGVQYEAVASAQLALTRVREVLRSGRELDAVIVAAPVGALELRALMDILQGGDLDGRVPLIMLSQPGGPSALSGLDQYLTVPLSKPLRMSELHRALSDALTGRLERRPRHSVSRSPRQSHPRKILVVDDNHVNQFVVAEQLAELGYQVELADNGAQAVAMVRDYAYLVVLMDCQMPVMDGYTATALIRQEEQRTGRHQLIIALTAHAMAGERERVMAAGMDDYLTKPVRGSALARAIAHHARREGLELPMADEASSDETSRELPKFVPGDGAHDGVSGEGARPPLDPKVKRSQLLVQTCLRELPKHLDALMEAVDASNSQLLRMSAHKLKGGALAIGAEPLAQCAARLQEAADDGGLEGCTELLDELRRQYDVLHQALRAELQRQSACA